MRTLFPLTDYPDFPDSFHPSVNGSKRIAETLAAALPGAKKTSALTTAKTSSLDSRDSGAPPSVSPSGLPSLPSRKTRLNIAVIGSSMERNVVLDGSSIPCGIIMRAAPCLYEDLSPLSYPTFLGALTNATIYNLSVAGSQAADNKTAGTIPPALDTQVPNIPANVDIVILQIGLNDTSISATIEVTLNRVDKVVAAVRARAPNARIIFVSLRDYGASFHQRITDWNAREMRVARSIGATVVDIRTPFPATDYTDFPDGTHASVIGGLRVAQLIEAAIDKMRVPAQPSK
jgi:lysophospholipase L1-like esterase